MHRLPASIAIIVSALLLDASATADHRWREAGTPFAPSSESRLNAATVPRALRADERRTVDGPAPSPRSAAGRQSLPGAKHAIRLRGGSKHLVVHGTLNDALSGPMLVDTGASYCVLTRTVARRLHLGRATSIGAVPVATANGQVLADLVELDSVQLDGARIAGVEAVIMDAVDPPLIGIIGLSFLNHFRYSVDHAEGTIQLER